MKSWVLTLTVGASLSLSACGGGGTTAPPPTTYTISGTVSGLSGTGLVVQDNLDDLSVTANGGFTFTSPIASGSTYSVVVLTQPSGPTQVCAVTNGSGVVSNANVTNVQLTCSTITEKVLYSFGQAPDGNYPAASLVFDGSGNLYGTTVQGGAFGYGSVFKLAPGNGVWTETVIYSFCPHRISCPDGATPYSSLVLDAAGNLYGTTYQGGAYASSVASDSRDGVVFELTPQLDGTWTETVLHSFGNGTDGVGPLAGLVFDRAGNLYGTTAAGGTTASSSCFGGCGTVFELSPGTKGQWTEMVLYDFCSQAGCADGNDPDAALIFDVAGNLYGTTFYGGTPGLHLSGTVFELTPGENGQWVQTVLYMFQGAPDGSNPHARLIQDKSGNLYGTTASGGSAQGGGSVNNGIAFKLTPESGGQWTESLLHVFCSNDPCTDGSQPLGDLVFDKAGNLYGTTFSAGAFQWGVVFEFMPGNDGNWIEVPLYAFQGATDGLNPHAGAILDASGNVYGLTYQGGTYGYGLVFEVTP